MCNKNKEFRQKGQTLMEILIYIAIFGTVASSLVGIVWNVTKIHSYQLASNEVDSNLRYAMNLINDKVRGASSVESAASSTLTLKMPNNTTTTFSVTGGVLYIKEGSADPVAVISDRVAVSSLTFEKIDMAGAKGGARVNLTLNYVPKEGGTTSLQRTLISAVNRSATAISFSEDIIPGQNSSYSVGSISYNWKNGYFSGDVTVNGTLKGTTVCIGTDCKTAWPSGSSGTVTGSGTTNKVAKWTSSSALGNSVIYDDGTNVGIGTTSPGAKLDVAGGVRVDSGSDYAGLGIFSGQYMTHSWRSGWGPYTSSKGNYAVLLDSGNATTDSYFAVSKDSGSSPTELFRVQENGNVGIGTTSPGAKLDIRGDSIIYSTNGPYMEGWSAFYTGSAATGGGLNLHIGAAGTAPGSGTLKSYLRVRGTNYNTILGIYGGAVGEVIPIEVVNANGNVLLAQSTGNVGIGTTGPLAKLHVVGATDSPSITAQSGIFRLESPNTGLDMGIYSSPVNGTYIQTTNTPASGGGSFALVLNPLGGNVGIGTTGPTVPLTLANGGTIGWINSNSYTFGIKKLTNDLHFISTSGNDPSTGTDSMVLYGAGNVALVPTTGNVGIGTTGPTYPLDVYTTSGSGLRVRSSGSTLNVNLRGDGAPAGNANIGISGGTSYIGPYSSLDTHNLVITNGGNVGIGTTSPNAKLTVNGGFFQTSGLQIYSGSFSLSTGQSITLITQDGVYSQTFCIVAIEAEAGWQTGSAYDAFLDGYGLVSSATSRGGNGAHITLTSSADANHKGYLTLQNPDGDTRNYRVVVYAFQMYSGASMSSSYLSLN